MHVLCILWYVKRHLQGKVMPNSEITKPVALVIIVSEVKKSLVSQPVS